MRPASPMLRCLPMRAMGAATARSRVLSRCPAPRGSSPPSRTLFAAASRPVATRALSSIWPFANPSTGLRARVDYLGVGLPTRYLDGGRMGYDPAAACQCLQDLATVNCGLLTSQTLDALRTSSRGRRARDGAHPGSSERRWRPGQRRGRRGRRRPDRRRGRRQRSRMRVLLRVRGRRALHRRYSGTPAADAGLGTCKPLVGDGGVCQTTDQCSYLGNGTPSLYCTANTCVPRLAAGVACSATSECQSNLCVPGSGNALTCASGQNFSNAATCAFFAVQDAGDGG